MALSPQLLQFKSSGVYRLEFDKSQTANINVETLRLVVGHSRKGPYNTPVLIENVEQFIQVFGNIDRNLEKKGMFFHRSAQTALSRGPILALNLINFENTDLASYQRPVTNGGQHGLSSSSGTDAYSDFLKADKFAIPSDEAVLSQLSNDSNRIFNFVNIKQESITVFVRKAQDTDGFDITAREWYGEGNVPAFLNEKDYVSDYMVDVFVFKGEFNAASLDTDPVYGAYFTSVGLDKTKLDEFANLRQVELIAKYSGSLIPGFKDLEGRDLYVENAINAESRRTGLFCAIDEDKVMDETGSQVDLVGHTWDVDQDYELLSYVVGQSITGVASKSFTETVTYDAGAYTNNNPGAVNGDPTFAFSAVDWSTTVMTQTSLSGTTNGDGTENRVDSFTGDFIDHGVTYSGATLTVTGVFDETTGAIVGNASAAFSYGSGITRTFVITHGGGDVNSATGTSAELIIGDQTTGTVDNNDPYTLTIVNYDNAGGEFASGRFLLAESAGEYVEITNVSVSNGDTTITADGPIATSLAFGETDNKTIALYAIENSRARDYAFTNGTYAANGTQFTVTYANIDAPSSFPLAKGHYVPNASGARLAKISKVSKSVGSVNTVFSISTDDLVPSVWGGYYFKSFEDASSVYKPFVLGKAQIGAKSITDCLSAVYGTALASALADKDAIDFRYIVDTFGSFDSGNILNKFQLSDLAQTRQNAAAILNAPTVEDFKASTDPSFKDANGTFKTSYIKDGGNLDQNPTSLYALPGLTDGANYGFFYAPGLIVRESGKDIIVPPAAYVSNNYIDKYTDALPWSIVAGPRRGVVSGTNVVGAEYAFDKSDRDILEPFGINPIVFQRGVGLTILGNKTGQQSIKSALSSAHVREVLIYIQEGMADILKDYVFEFNNAQTRLEIKTLADSFMESVQQDGGVYDFKNVMDQTNNTDEVIDNNIGIIDTFVEPVKGLEIVVHRTTILNTGEIQTGNFS
jgi:hypothetical protein